jgi:hypothetical protein
MIDLTAERLLTLSEAAALLPGHPSIATLWRWRTKGIRGRRLETVIVGSRPYTTVEALQRFADQRGGADFQPIRSPKQRDRAIAAAEHELRQAGIDVRLRGTPE